MVQVRVPQWQFVCKVFIGKGLALDSKGKVFIIEYFGSKVFIQIGVAGFGSMVTRCGLISSVVFNFSSRHG